MSHSASTGPRAKPTYATPEKYDVASPRRLGGREILQRRRRGDEVGGFGEAGQQAEPHDRTDAAGGQQAQHAGARHRGAQDQHPPAALEVGQSSPRGAVAVRPPVRRSPWRRRHPSPFPPARCRDEPRDRLEHHPRDEEVPDAGKQQRRERRREEPFGVRACRHPVSMACTCARPVDPDDERALDVGRAGRSRDGHQLAGQVLDVAQVVAEGVDDGGGVDDEDAGRGQQAGRPSLIVVGSQEDRPGLCGGRHRPHHAEGGTRGRLGPALGPTEIGGDVDSLAAATSGPSKLAA